jgi:hypothetical protein
MLEPCVRVRNAGGPCTRAGAADSAAGGAEAHQRDVDAVGRSTRHHAQHEVRAGIVLFEAKITAAFAAFALWWW